MLSESSTLRLATQLECLPLLLGDRSPVAIKRRPVSGKWSAHENLAHLARYHEVFIERIQRILIEERPHLARYRAEDDPEWPQWAAMPTDEVMRKLKALRSELIKAVTHLPSDQLSRIGVHPILGDMTIPLWIEFFLLHEAHHLYVLMGRVRTSE